MTSKQAAAYQISTLRRLQALVPHDCPLLVQCKAGGGFLVQTINGQRQRSGRFEVVAAWIEGYASRNDGGGA